MWERNRARGEIYRYSRAVGIFMPRRAVGVFMPARRAAVTTELNGARHWRLGMRGY
jgi:hypothetical protein